MSNLLTNSGFPRGTYTSASVWVFMVAFEMYYVGFGQMIASFSPNELLASLLVPMFFLFVVSFCGVVVPYMALPTFWRSWMYHLTPFTYLLEGFLGLITDGVPVFCDRSEIVIVPPPPGQSCDQYLGPLLRMSGRLQNELAPQGQCGYCQYADGNQFAASFNVYAANVWRDFGIFWAYIFFNFAVVFACSWLYLQGGAKILGFFSPTARREKKAVQQRRREAGDNKA